MIGPGDTVRAVNHEHYPVTIGWGNVNYILHPEQDAYVPAEAIINFFGDPRSKSTMQRIEEANGQSAWILDRETEVRRLRVKWASLNVGNGEEELVTPKVDVFTLEGKEVPTVANDPKGLTVNPTISTQYNEITRDEVIARMQEQLDTLLKERNIQQMVEPVTTEDSIPVDDMTVSKPPAKRITAKAANDE